MTPPEVMMLHLEEIQLFFLAHPDGDCGYTDVQIICQAVKNTRVLGHIYIKALTNWNREDPTHQKVWTNFKTCIYTQYEKMPRERGGGTLSEDGYKAFNAIAMEDIQALTESIVNYAERLSRLEAWVDALQAQLDIMAMQQQPRIENFANNAVY